MPNYRVYREAGSKVIVDAVVAANAISKHITGPVVFVYRGTLYNVGDTVDSTVLLSALPAGWWTNGNPLPDGVRIAL